MIGTALLYKEAQKFNIVNKIYVNIVLIKLANNSVLPVMRLESLVYVFIQCACLLLCFMSAFYVSVLRVIFTNPLYVSDLRVRFLACFASLPKIQSRIFPVKI